MSFSPTVLQDSISNLAKNKQFVSRELRGSIYGALDTVAAQTELLVPKAELERVRQASSQTQKINVYNKIAAGSGTARKCTGSGTGTTAQSTLSWSTIVEEFALSYIEHEGNQIKYQAAFEYLLDQKLKAIYKRIDEKIVAAMEANYSAGDGDSFTLFNDAFQVPLSQYDIATTRAATWMNKVKADVMKNDFDPDMLQVVGDSNMKAVMSSMMNQGQYTETDLGFQFQGVDSAFTNRVTNNNGIYATGYIFEKGAMGLLTWTNQLSRNGENIGTDIWTTMVDPRYGLTMELKVKKACTDNSGSYAGAQADLVESFVIAIDVATPVAYNSDGNTGIYKYELNEDNTVSSGSGSY